MESMFNQESFSSPIFVWWQITHRCNLKCVHCFAYNVLDELNTEECKKVIDQLSEARVMILKITGGEPLIRRDIFELLSYINSKGLDIILSTNATLINEEIAGKLKEVGVEYVQVSLDSANRFTHEKIRGKGTFDKVIGGIKNLLENQIKVSIVTTLMSYNVSEISETVDFVYKLGVKKFLTRRLVMYGRARERWSELAPQPQQLIKAYEILKKKSEEYPDMIIVPDSSYMFGIDPSLIEEGRAPTCECGKTQCGIKPDGTVVPCEYVTIPAGNLREKSFLEIWNNAEIFKKFRELDVKKLKGKCSYCKFKMICKGGCRAAALFEYGDFYAEDPLCWLKVKNDKM